jgi:hypothetical protein
MTISPKHRLSLVLAVLVFAVAPLATAAVKDGRSPDTKDAAALASFDGRSPDTLDAAALASTSRTAPLAPAAVVDGRSPDTRDAAARAVIVPVSVGTGFDWGDAGIGAAGGFAIALVVGGALLVVTLRHHGGRLAS